MEEDSIRISKAASDETNSSIFYPKSIETINENDIVDLLNKLLNSCQEGEVYILSNSIMNVIGLQSGVVDAVVRARAATEPLIQIIYSPSEKQSKAGSKTLSDLIIENETIRNSLLTTGFVELVLHTLTSNNQIQSKSSSSSSDIIPIFIKIGLLDIVLKLVTTARGLQPLSLLIPILEELQLSGEDELINKSKIILNNLKVEGIKASSSTQIKEKLKKKKQENIRYREELKQKNEENMRKDDEKLKKDEEMNKITEDFHQQQNENVILNQKLQQKDDEIQREQINNNQLQQEINIKNEKLIREIQEKERINEELKRQKEKINQKDEENRKKNYEITQVIQEKERIKEDLKKKNKELKKKDEKLHKMNEEKENEKSKKQRIDEEFSQERKIKIQMEQQINKLTKCIQMLKEKDYKVRNSYNQLLFEDLKRINEILRLPLIGTQQQQQILKQQEDECNKLITRIKDQIDEEGKLDIVKSGIVEQLINIFLNRPFDLITKPYSSLFYVLTYPSSNEVNLQLYNKHPYPSLIRLLNHENTNVVNDAIISIFNILASGSYVTLSKSLHPHFDSISDCDGINQIYKIFKRKDIQKDIKDTIAELFGHLYRAREITNIKIRKDIIAHLKSLIMKKDKDEMTHSIHALNRLAPNSIAPRLRKMDLLFQINDD